MQIGNGAPPPTEAAVRRDRFLGLSILGATFALAIAGSLWSKAASRSVHGVPERVGITEGIAGWPNAVDPVSILGKVRQLAGPKEFRGMLIRGMRSDGRLDLTEGPGHVRYVFQESATMEPPRVEGGKPKKRCIRQDIELDAAGLVVGKTRRTKRCPSPASPPLPNPTCGPRELWKHPLARAVPEEISGLFEYYRAKAGPAWRMIVHGRRLRLETADDCSTGLGPKEASGHVP